jgi:hypothetical protein
VVVSRPVLSAPCFGQLPPRDPRAGTLDFVSDELVSATSRPPLGRRPYRFNKILFVIALAIGQQIGKYLPHFDGQYHEKSANRPSYCFQWR